MTVRKNDVVTLTVEGYGTEGEGVARLDGMAVFVKGALRGEVCRVRLMKIGKSAAWGRLEEVLTPSPARVSPDCPHYPKCGGCQLRHMSYEEELELKRRRVEDALARIGGVSLPVSEILGAEDTIRYRNKAQFPVARDGDGLRIGFYRARSHQVIDVPACLLQSEQADRLRGAIRAWMEEYGVPAYDEETGAGLIRHVYVRTNARGQALLCLLVNGARLPREEELTARLRAACPELVGAVLGINRRRGNGILGEEYRTLWGQDWLEDVLCGLTFRLSVPSFYQVNRAQAEVLYRQAGSLAGLTGRETVLDLYCGTGTIGLTMAGRAGRVIGCEVVPQSVEDARANAARNGIENAEFFCGDAGAVAQKLARERLRPDVIVVDPPRKGMGPEVVEAIAAMSPERLVYVSCDPATLARDVQRLGQRGYQAVRATAVDMFPRTAHVETALLLTRTDDGE